MERSLFTEAMEVCTCSILFQWFQVFAHIPRWLFPLLDATDPVQVDILRAEVLWIRDVSAKVRRQSEEDLRTGVRQGNHIGLSVALQVWRSLFY